MRCRESSTHGAKHNHEAKCTRELGPSSEALCDIMMKVRAFLLLYEGALFRLDEKETLTDGGWLDDRNFSKDGGTL